MQARTFVVSAAANTENAARALGPGTKKSEGGFTSFCCEGLLEVPDLPQWLSRVAHKRSASSPSRPHPSETGYLRTTFD